MLSCSVGLLRLQQQLLLLTDGPTTIDHLVMFYMKSILQKLIFRPYAVRRMLLQRFATDMPEKWFMNLITITIIGIFVQRTSSFVLQ